MANRDRSTGTRWSVLLYYLCWFCAPLLFLFCFFFFVNYNKALGEHSAHKRLEHHEWAD